jgi:hypothetical protein
MHCLRRNRHFGSFGRMRLAGMGSRCLVLSVALLSFPAAGLAAPAVPWSKLPHMQLERQFAGPLQDTIIQRWRDPADGTICYIYLPITAQHSAPTASGYVQYGPNIIGTLSCLEAKAPEKHAEAPAGKKREPDRAGDKHHR